MSMMVYEGGDDYSYLHVYSEVANTPSYVNGISTDSYY